jgi:hypothetical protein
MTFRSCLLRSGFGVCLVLTALLSPRDASAEVTVKTVPCFNLPNCLSLSNGQVEVVVTTDIGPRIARYAFVAGENILGESGGSIERKTVWQAWGGHRLWIAPEDRVRSYGPDNSPITHTRIGTRGIRLTQPVEPTTGIEKTIVVTLDETGTGVTVEHTLTNRGPAPTELAPWALSIMNGGGTAILPQEPYKRHQDALLPARAIVLWHYTDLSDPRFQIGPRFLRLKTDAAMKEPQKVGASNRVGWTAYHRQGQLFIKRTAWQEGQTYPDYGSSIEIYTQSAFIEVESLGPLVTLKPGESASHTERWFLFKDVPLPKTDAELEKVLAPLVEKAQ